MHAGKGWEIARWFEHVESAAEAELVAEDGAVACWRAGKRRYLAAWPEGALIDEVVARAARGAGLLLHDLPEGVRLRSAGARTFAFNYSAAPATVPASVAGDLVLGTRALGPAQVAVFASA
jgi:beta-galactosidase